MFESVARRFAGLPLPVPRPPFLAKIKNYFLAQRKHVFVTPSREMESHHPALSRPARSSRVAPVQCCVRAASGRRFSSPARRRLCVQASGKRSEYPRRFDAARCEQVPQIVMRDAICADLFARAIKRLLAFADAENFSSSDSPGRSLTHSFKQRARIGNQRHAAQFPIFVPVSGSPRTTISPASKSTSRQAISRASQAAACECQAAAKSAQSIESRLWPARISPQSTR